VLQSFDDGNSDEARQFLLDRRCERIHPKRHRTMKRAKGISSAKRARIKHKNAMKARKISAYKAKVAEYWAGASEVHP